MQHRLRKITYRCTDCKFSFEKMQKFSIEKYPAGTELPDLPKKDPACPQCKQARRVNFKNAVSDKTHEMDDDARVQDMIAAAKPPAMGKSNFTKAMDATADIVMQDYGLTNLQDNLRAGDSMAPKLRPDLERRVDEVFKPQKPIMGTSTASALNTSLTRQINAGAFKNYGGASDVVARQQASGIRPQTNVLFEHNERPH